MKHLILPAMICLCIFTQSAFAQIDNKQNARDGSREKNNLLISNENSTTTLLRTYKTKLGNGKGQRVVVYMTRSSVQVIGYNSEDVLIETTSYKTPSTQSKGLKPVYNQVEDNTQLGLQVRNENNSVKITQASVYPAKYVIRVPKDASVYYQEIGDEGEEISIQDVNGEIELKQYNGGATLANVSGPVVANSTNGNYKVTFKDLFESKPCALSSINGNVDITLPASTKSDLKLKSLLGEVYTDFVLKTNKDAESNLPKIVGGQNITASINGGGVEISVTTMNKDIFIRKGK